MAKVTVVDLHIHGDQVSIDDHFGHGGGDLRNAAVPPVGVHVVRDLLKIPLACLGLVDRLLRPPGLPLVLASAENDVVRGFWFKVAAGHEEDGLFPVGKTPPSGVAAAVNRRVSAKN